MKSKQPVNIKSTELISDDKNFNKGSDIGAEMIRKSFEKFGAGRSILLDKNNRIIAGNKSVEYSGIKDILVIESDGSQLIAVKRTDIDLDSQQGREMALADNASAKANIVFDAELVEAELGVAVCEEWLPKPNYDAGLDVNNMTDDDVDLEEEFDPIGNATDLHKVIFIFDNEIEAGIYFDEKIKGLEYKKFGGGQGKQWQVNLSKNYGK